MFWKKKIGIRSPIQAFPQPFDLFHIVKNFRSWFLVVFPHVKTVIMIRESMRASKTRWFLKLDLFQMTPIGYQPWAVWSNGIEWLSSWFGTLQENCRDTSFQDARKASTWWLCKCFVFPKARPVLCDIFIRTEIVCLLSRYSWSALVLRCCLVHPNWMETVSG